MQMHVMGVDETHFVQYSPGTDELIYDAVKCCPDFMKNPIFAKFRDDVEARKTRMTHEPLKGKKRKRD